MEIMPDGTMAEMKSEPRLPLPGDASETGTVAAVDGSAGAGSGAGNTPQMAMDADVPGVTATAAAGQQLGGSPLAGGGMGVGVINGPNGSHFPRP
jgi:hypothetical protein